MFKYVAFIKIYADLGKNRPELSEINEKCDPKLYSEV